MPAASLVSHPLLTPVSPPWPKDSRGLPPPPLFSPLSCPPLILSPILKLPPHKEVRSLFGQKQTPSLSRGAFNIFSQPSKVLKNKKKKCSLRSNNQKAHIHLKKTIPKPLHVAKILQEEESIESDLKADLEADHETLLPNGDPLSPLEFPPSGQILNLSMGSPTPALFSPIPAPQDLGLSLDHNAKKLLQNLMIQKEDPDSVLDTPLAVLYSQVKEKRKLGLHHTQEGLEKPDFGLSPLKKGRKSLIEARSLDGAAENQSKLQDLWKVGKGNPLPEQQ